MRGLMWNMQRILGEREGCKKEPGRRGSEILCMVFFSVGRIQVGPN